MNVPGLTLSLLMKSFAVVQNANAQGMITGDLLAKEISKTVNAVGWSFIQVPKFSLPLNLGSKKTDLHLTMILNKINIYRFVQHLFLGNRWQYSSMVEHLVVQHDHALFHWLSHNFHCHKKCWNLFKLFLVMKKASLFIS